MFGRKVKPVDQVELERELRERGETATVTVYSKTPHMRPDKTVEWTFHVTVQSHGEWHKVEFSYVLPASHDLRYPTLELPVLFDPDEPERMVVDVTKLPEFEAAAAAASGAGPGAAAAREAAAGWKLPALCPHCGAPVDQAVQSVRVDPHCDFCHEPLPVQGGQEAG